MTWPDLQPWQWAVGAAAAWLVGISKTGVPGAGILTPALIALVFSGRLAPGALLPLLIAGDLFAVAWYRQHARWDYIRGLAGWLALGMALGAAALHWAASGPFGPQMLDRVLGAIVLAMLGLHLMRKKLGDRIVPTTSFGRAFAGSTAGFATTVSNAAGPVTGIYLTAAKANKQEFVGTGAWLYLLINSAKVPLYFGLTTIAPKAPMFTQQSLLFNLAVLPAVVLGALLGRVLLNRMPQGLFDGVVLTLAGAAAAKLLLGL